MNTVWSDEHAQQIETAAAALHFGPLEATHEGDDDGHLAALGAQLTQQLIVGCGSSECKNAHCLIGRRNIKTAPTRAHTLASARTIATALLFRPDAARFRCREFEASPLTLSDDTPGPDRASLTQQLSNTKTIDRLTSIASRGPITSRTHSEPPRRALIKAQDMLSKLREPPFNSDGTRNPTFTNNAPAADTLTTVWCYVKDHLAPQEISQSCQEELRRICQFDLDHDEDDVAGSKLDESPCIRELALNLRYSQSLAIVAEICSVICHRQRLDTAMAKAGLGHNHFQALMMHTFLSMNTISECPTLASVRIIIMAQALQLCIRDKWDGKAVLPQTCDALVAMGLLSYLGNEIRHEDRQWIYGLTADLDAIAVAESWLSFDRKTSVHILQLRVLHSPAKLHTYFIMINHLKMRQTHVTKSIVDGLRHEFLAMRATPSIRQAKVLEDLQQTYFVLRVRREHVLEDAFDQLSGLHGSDLFKPLRVRIVEMDGQAIGQDLGGVQVEFFNLVVTAMLDENAGLFTQMESGYVYPRTGSLQPIHMFECIGLLFGLALYNGIPLPIILPDCFYKIVGDLWNDELHPYDKGWPPEISTLSKMEEQDVTSWGIDYSFIIEANGLRLELSAAATSALKYDEEVIPILSVTCIDDPSRIIQPDEIDWPGWRFATQAEQNTDNPVTEENKKAYADDYMRLVTYWAVRPQMRAIRAGLRRIHDQETLELVLSSLPTIFEASEEIDLSNVQQRTRYEGLEVAPEYIDTFWSVVGAWDKRKQGALIRFVTASQRVPPGGGMRLKIHFTHNEDEQRLPTSSTCFNTLYLPIYSSAELLDEKLSKAVELGELGFFVG